MSTTAIKTAGTILVSGILAASLFGCASTPQQSSSAGDAAQISSSQAQSSPETANTSEVPDVNFDANDLASTMVSSEAFVDEYVDFMKEYKAKGEPASMLDEYNDLNAKYNDLMSKLDSISESNYDNAEWQAYTEAMARISDKLQELSA